MKEYTEEKSAWYLCIYNKRADEKGNNFMLEMFEVPNIAIYDILQVFYDRNHDLEAEPIFCIEITTKEQAKWIQKYVKEHIVDLEKYFYSLDCLYSPRVYTVYGFKKLIERNDINDLGEALCSFARCNANLADFISVLKMVDKFNERDIRFGSMQIIRYIVAKNMSINDELLLYYLEKGINDPDKSISNKIKISINNLLSKNNLKLYEHIKSKYDLYVPDDCYLL